MFYLVKFERFYIHTDVHFMLNDDHLHPAKILTSISSLIYTHWLASIPPSLVFLIQSVPETAEMMGQKQREYWMRKLFALLNYLIQQFLSSEVNPNANPGLVCVLSADNILNRPAHRHITWYNQLPPWFGLCLTAPSGPSTQTCPAALLSLWSSLPMW